MSRAPESEKTRILHGDDVPTIHIHMRLRKTMGILPPWLTRMWLGAKSLMFIGALIASVVHLFDPDVISSRPLRWIAAFLVVWFVWDQFIAKNRFGLSHIIVATNGIFFTESNFHVAWDDIESYQVTTHSLRLRPRPSARANGVLAPRHYDLPLTTATRERLLESFREHVGRPVA